MTSKKRLRLVHTSDIHLGMYKHSDHASLALTAVVDTVLRLEADMLLIAGDLFDHSRVPDEMLEFFTGQMSRLPVPVVLLPGNHDSYDSTSVYLREHFGSAADGLHIVSSTDGETIPFPNLGISVWGKAIEQHSPRFRPLQGMPPRPEGDWFVAMAHGHFHYDYDKDERSSPILPEEIASATCDYIALGHWDRFVDVSQNGVRACYSGTPTSMVGGNSLGGVAVVGLNPLGGVEVQRLSLDMGQ